MADAKPPRFRADGALDERGHAAGSKPTRFTANDGRSRPGRPKGSRDERTIINKLRALPVHGTDGNGRKRKFDTYEAILMKMRQMALGGNIKAMEALLKRLDRYATPSAEPDRTRQLLEEDAFILETAHRRGIFPGRGDGNEGRSE